MAYVKLGPFVDGGAPYLSHDTLNALDQAAWDGYYGTGFLTLDSQYQAADGTDWAVTLTRALTAAAAAGTGVLLTRMYPVASTVNLPTGARLVGLGAHTGLQAPTGTAIVILKGSNVNNVVLDNFTVDGNCATTTTKSFSRSVQFLSSSKLRVHRLTTRYNPDWACSFESCTDVYVTDYVHQNGTTGNTTAFAGRDGIHFLDSSDVVLDGAKIHSYDDCVGITSLAQNINRITVRNVTGVSQVAAVVTLGNEAASAFTASDITAENITTYLSPDYGNPPNYVVKFRAQNGSVAQRIRVTNVSGTAVSHGVWLEGTTGQPMTDVVVGNVNVTSTTNHGIWLHYVSWFELAAARGASTAGAYDGVNLGTCQYGAVSGAARNCSLWGLQLNACTSVDVTGFVARDNGGNNFGAATGGNGRLVNCTDVYVNGGQFVGSATVSYNGISQSGNTTTVVSANTRVGGAH